MCFFKKALLLAVSWWFYDNFYFTSLMSFNLYFSSTNGPVVVNTPSLPILFGPFYACHVRRRRWGLWTKSPQRSLRAGLHRARAQVECRFLSNKRTLMGCWLAYARLYTELLFDQIQKPRSGGALGTPSDWSSPLISTSGIALELAIDSPQISRGSPTARRSKPLRWAPRRWTQR